MKSLRSFALLAALAFAGAVQADQAARDEAEKLFDAIGMQATVDQTVTVMIDAQIRQNPGIAPFRAVILRFFTKYMGYAAVKSNLVDIYEAEFSAAELREVREFYASPTGRKMLAKQPLLARKAVEIGQKRVQENIAELQRMIEEERKRQPPAPAQPPAGG